MRKFKVGDKVKITRISDATHNRYDSVPGMHRMVGKTFTIDRIVYAVRGDGYQVGGFNFVGDEFELDTTFRDAMLAGETLRMANNTSTTRIFDEYKFIGYAVINERTRAGYVLDDAGNSACCARVLPTAKQVKFEVQSKIVAIHTVAFRQKDSWRIAKFRDDELEALSLQTTNYKILETTQKVTNAG